MATLSFANIKENIVGVTTTTSTVTAADTSGNIISNVSSASNTLSKTFNRITVHNVLSESNALNLNHVANGTHNTIIRKIRDFGMFGAVNNATNKATTATTTTVAARKRPLGESKLNDENKQPKLQNSMPKKTKLHKEAMQKDKQPTGNKSKQDKMKAQAKNAPATTTTAAATALPTTTTAMPTTIALAAPTTITTTQTATAAATPTLTQQQKPAGTPGRKGLPLPQAVARRNARERNRVKQVNNGFAALRERIPDEVSEAFEAQGNGRGSAKKLSKVETLRMAVEYIRSLERLLGFDFPVPNSASTSCSSSSGEDSFMIIKDEYDAMDDEHYDDSMSNYELEEGNNNNNSNNNYGAMTATAMQTLDEHMQHATNVSGNSDASSIDDANGMGGMGMELNLDLLPNVTTLHGLQYVRIPGTNTYQLFTADIFSGNASNSSIDEEHFNGLIDANCMSPTSVSSVRNAATTMATTTTTAATINNIESAAPAASAAAAATVESLSNGECVNYAINAGVATTTTTATTLSRSTPVPQPQSQSSPSPTGSSSLHQQESLQQQQRQHHLQPPTTTSAKSAIAATALPITTTTTAATTTTARTRSKTVSPATAVHATAAVANELLLQTCAVDRQFVAPATTPQQQQQQQQQQLIKQEFCDRNLANTTTTTTTALPTDMQISLKQLIYQHATTHQQQQQQQQQQQLMLSHASSSMSPPTTTTTNNAQTTPIAPLLAMSPGLQAFYEHDHSSFYEGVVTLKKEFNDILLDTSTTTGGLSDESMIDAIDWWEAHTPKSDGGSVIM